MLLAGAGANSTPALGGALSFSVNASPSYAGTGATVPLIAGACTTDPYSSGGAFAFDVPGLPSDTWWFTGSAFIYIMLVSGAGVLPTLLPGVALLRLI